MTTVLIIGAGPTGCTLALLLAKLGISVALVERNAEPQQHPAACILNTRTMEVFREIGVEEQIQAACQNPFDRGYITWVVSLAGRELGRCRVVQDREELLALSPTYTVQFPQHRLEPMLWQRIQRHPGITFYRHSQCVAVTQTDDEVSATLVQPTTGEQNFLRGAYLVACDGASSLVRRSLNIAMSGPVLQHMIGMHFVADLRAFVDHRPGVLYWVLNREVLGVLIAHWLPTEWVLFVPYFPPQQTFEDYNPAVCLDLIASALGTRDVPDLELKMAGAWVLTAKLADRFRWGRAFLAGDAGAQFSTDRRTGPEHRGSGCAQPGLEARGCGARPRRARLLDTYETERRPIAEINLRHSVRNYEKMNDLNKVVGLDFAHLRMLTAIQNSRMFLRSARDLAKRRGEYLPEMGPEKAGSAGLRRRPGKTPPGGIRGTPAGPGSPLPLSGIGSGLFLRARSRDPGTFSQTPG